jgi:acetoin utilization protein AcuB
MPLEKLFKERVVEETDAIAAQRPIEEKGHYDTSESHAHQPSAAQAYRAVEQLLASPAVLLAEQVMTAPVVSLAPNAMITEALRQFQANAFRHVPVASSTGRLVGIVSERDILRHLAGLTAGYQSRLSSIGDLPVKEVMTPQVLTANVDTDVRYIARLFVEQRIGAVPVARDGVLQGIVTRSDVLGAVMRRDILEIWA